MTLPPGNPMIRVLQVFLLLDVIVFALVIPGMIQVSDRSVLVSALSGGGAIVLALVAAATIRRGAVGFALGWLTQVVGIALGILTPFQLITGAVFAVLWVTTFVLGKRLAAAQPTS
ncbi:MAG TPA: DUF4233 domain-containing protein [Propionibacteriaceae bacterium]|nr:DUF4233 domain-containing protein [Propionibacteriaceae bacterium]